MKPNRFCGFDIDFTSEYRTWKESYKDGEVTIFNLETPQQFGLKIKKPIMRRLETYNYVKGIKDYQVAQILFNDFYISIFNHRDPKSECDYNVFIHTLNNPTKNRFAESLVYLLELLGLQASILGDSQCIEVLGLPYYPDYYISVEGMRRNLGNHKNYVGVTKQYIQSLLLNTSTLDKDGNSIPLKPKYIKF